VATFSLAEERVRGVPDASRRRLSLRRKRIIRRGGCAFPFRHPLRRLEISRGGNDCRYAEGSIGGDDLFAFVSILATLYARDVFDFCRNMRADQASDVLGTDSTQSYLDVGTVSPHPAHRRANAPAPEVRDL